MGAYSEVILEGMKGLTRSWTLLTSRFGIRITY